MSKVHFSEDVYVVYRRRQQLEYPHTHLVDEIQRGLTYAGAIGLCSNLCNKDETQPNTAYGNRIHLYGYMPESRFDEEQEPFKVNPQLSLF